MFKWLIDIDVRKVTAVISILVVLELAIAQGTISLTDAIPASWIPVVVAWSKILAVVGSAITGTHNVAALFSPRADGPSLGQGAAVKALVMLAVLLASLIFAPPAMAQSRPVLPPLANPFKLPSVAPKPAVAKASPAASSAQTLDPLAWLRQFSTDDVAYALKDAQAQNDLTTIPCWTFLQTLLGANPSASLLPNQLGLATGIQKIFDDETLLANWLVPNGTLDQLNLACDPMINKLKMQGVAGGAALATAIAAGPAGIPALLSGLGAILTGATALAPLGL
jgi:hypothetical protein